MSRFDEFGANAGLIEELYAQYLADPGSVNEEWRAFLASTTDGSRDARTGAPAPQLPPPPPKPQPRPPERELPPDGDGDPSEVLRGGAARLAENMDASLAVPTATSVRAISTRLLEVNRELLNDHLVRRGSDKVSYTHLIAYAVVRALERFPALNASFRMDGDTPTVVRHRHVNLGIAVDVRRRDGSRNLLVPNIKAAESLDFPAFRHAYEELIGKVRAGTIGTDDMRGTTGTITNPGMLGTLQSIPRLMPGQGFIVGVGAIGPPAEYAGLDVRARADLGIGSVVNLTNTYDHRIISGAESGEFLSRVHDLLLGADGFYDEVFRAEGVPAEPARWAQDHPAHGNEDAVARKVVCVNQLINMFRVRGHLLASLDPLGRDAPHTNPELDLAHYGLTIWDLEREFPVDAAPAFGQSPIALRTILSSLRRAYAGTSGVEYMHIQDPVQKSWIQARVEGGHEPLTADDQRRILDRLQAAETLERFLHTKYLGHKRFSLEGAEVLIPMLDQLCSDAADAGIARLVLGMAHRGRLNVLANIIGKPYAEIFLQFEGDLDPAIPHGSGDVKYHLGARGSHTSPAGNTLELTLAANPSHLESVDPVVLGMARAAGDELGDTERTRVLPVLIHGDAAFAGQGVVSETLNSSDVPGYEVGGTVHIVVNNQLGFTTSPEAGRSSVYATDVAKMVQAPVFHVNADDAEAAWRTMRLAFAFRQDFHKDVVVDLVCYRRYGHNEADEPAFTQPRMYALIADHPSVRALYARQLVQRGDLAADEEDGILDDLRARLADAYAQVHDAEPPRDAPPEVLWSEAGATRSGDGSDTGTTTRVDEATLRRIVGHLQTVPDGFAIHPKLQRMLTDRATRFDAGEVDWAHAEALAFGSLLLDGVPIRLVGQDTRRGTFSQRHGTLVAQDTEVEYTPLAHLDGARAPFMLYDSTLSELAALGFEYGYSVEGDRALVCWEAQFGDFANGAQVVIDQFLAAGDDKWGQASRLTLLLPHGYEGQGPEHSSARIERYLQLCADDNLRVVYPSTAAQYFHLLRRQARDPVRVPLICFTPKRYLRMPRSVSRVRELTDAGFASVLDDPAAAANGGGAPWSRVLCCTGKIGHELMERRDQLQAPVAVVRLEELFPFPAEQLRAILSRYPRAALRWVQEEPANQGAWTFVRPRLEELADAPVDAVTRPASASTATGSIRTHEREQAALLERAFAD